MQVQQSDCVLRAVARRKHLHFAWLTSQPTNKLGRLHSLLPAGMLHVHLNLRAQARDVGLLNSCLLHWGLRLKALLQLLQSFVQRRLHRRGEFRVVALEVFHCRRVLLRCTDLSGCWRFAALCCDLLSRLNLLLQLAAQSTNVALSISKPSRNLSEHLLESSDLVQQYLLGRAFVDSIVAATFVIGRSTCGCRIVLVFNDFNAVTTGQLGIVYGRSACILCVELVPDLLRLVFLADLFLCVHDYIVSLVAITGRWLCQRRLIHRG